jgi:hypothetical protein
MATHGIWQISGNPNQVALVESALNRCDFPFDKLKPKLLSEARKSSIPVEWADLSRYASSVDAPSAFTAAPHIHAHEGDDSGHGILYRNRVLGLAWYSGKVSLDISLESQSELAQEVMLSEGAHMVDFFYMTEDHREAIWDAYHPGLDTSKGHHGHDWFDAGGYQDFVGESFMAGFTKAYSDVDVVLEQFTHKSTQEAVAGIRRVLTPELVADKPPVAPEVPSEPPTNPEPPVTPEPTPPSPETPEAEVPKTLAFFATKKGKTFHDTHGGVKKHFEFASFHDAEEAGLRPCKTCKPEHKHKS